MLWAKRKEIEKKRRQMQKRRADRALASIYEDLAWMDDYGRWSIQWIIKHGGIDFEFYVRHERLLGHKDDRLDEGGDAYG